MLEQIRGMVAWAFGMLWNKGKGESLDETPGAAEAPKGTTSSSTKDKNTMVILQVPTNKAMLADLEWLREVARIVCDGKNCSDSVVIDRALEIYRAFAMKLAADDDSKRLLALENKVLMERRRGMASTVSTGEADIGPAEERKAVTA